MPVRVLTEDGRAVGAAALNSRTGEFVVVAAKAVILATGPCGRLGLPASGYLYGTYENPTNAGDGYSMAFHAGAELSGIECFQINPLIKDYNGPACAYVANPFGGYQVNAQGERFVDSDYWSGAMMSEVKQRDRVRARTHLPQGQPPARRDAEHARGHPAHHRAAHPRHLPRQPRPRLPHPRHRDAHLRNRFVQWAFRVRRVGRRACPHHRPRAVRGGRSGLRAAQLHDRRLRLRGPGRRARGVNAVSTAPAPDVLPADQIAAAHELIYRPLRHPDGPPQTQVEYKLRRFVNDYVAPPKTAAKLSIAVQTFDRMRDEIAGIGATTPHELMRAVEVSFIRDCAEMAARSSLTRTESRWGLYHDRSDTPERDDVEWRYHLNLRKTADGDIEFLKRPVAPYFVPVPGLDELPSGETEPIHVPQPALVGGQAPASEVSRVRDGAAAHPPSPRIAAVLALDEPTIEQLRPFLTDPDRRRAPHCRRRGHRAPLRRLRARAAGGARRRARRGAPRGRRRHPRTRRGAARSQAAVQRLLGSTIPSSAGSPSTW